MAVNSFARAVRRIRSRARRSRVATIALALAVGVGIRLPLEQAAAEERKWGDKVSVVRVVRPVPAGSVVSSADVETVSLPRGVVRGRTVPSAADVIGRRARVALLPGDTGLDGRVVATDSTLQAVLGRGRVGVAVPAGGARPEVEVGDRVAVYAPLRPVKPVRGEVVAATDDQLTLAVPSADGSTLASWVLAGPVALVVE